MEFVGELGFEGQSGSFLGDEGWLFAGGSVRRVLALDTGAVVVVLLQLLLALAVFELVSTVHLVDKLVHLQLRKAIFQHFRGFTIPVLVLLIEGEYLKLFPFLFGPIQQQFLMPESHLLAALHIPSLFILRRFPVLPVDPGQTQRRVELTRYGSDIMPIPALCLLHLQLFLKHDVIEYGFLIQITGKVLILCKFYILMSFSRMMLVSLSTSQCRSALSSASLPLRRSQISSSSFQHSRVRMRSCARMRSSKEGPSVVLRLRQLSILELYQWIISIERAPFSAILIQLPSNIINSHKTEATRYHPLLHHCSSPISIPLPSLPSPLPFALIFCCLSLILSVILPRSVLVDQIYYKDSTKMDSKLGIDFAEIKTNEESVSQKAILFNEGELLSHAFHVRKSSQAKKIRTVSRSQEELKTQPLTVLHSFTFSMRLLNLFRDPAVQGTHFKEDYLAEVGLQLRKTNPSESSEYDEIVLYLHLMLAQVDNLFEMQELGRESGLLTRFNPDKWNRMNIMNAKCLLANLRHFQLLAHKAALDPKINLLSCHIFKNNNAYLFEDGAIKISKNYLDLAINSNGHLDVYFGPFLLNKFSFEASLWFLHFQDTSYALRNYATIFQQVAKQAWQFQNTNFQEWYKEQVDAIVNNTFQIQDLISYLNFTHFNPYIERLLIGLQGWKGFTEEAVKYLNVYYDNCDWQINSEYNAIVAVNGQPFQVDYLIENVKKYRESVVICLKAPCYNPYYNGEVFTWHRPKLVEYVSDEESYIWVQMNLGVFRKCGFYDWTLFDLSDHGKEPINKILDIGSKGKTDHSASKIWKRSAITVKSVKGRYIVQPREIRSLNLHEISIDSLNSDHGIYKTPTFGDALKEVQRCKSLDINAVYLMGVFQRDNDQSLEVYRKPHASPTALTHRSLPCRMLGGSQEFKKLVQSSHEEGIKVIVDCSTRVSSSRMSKRYEKLRLKNVDEQGRIIYHYGCNGRSISYDDTTPLNYRKKQAWDLLLQEVMQIISEYHIDGIYLDNGFEWPQLHRINEEEMYRKQFGTNSPAYTNDQIFQGEVVYNNKITGYWVSKISVKYPNPFFINLCKKIWEKYPDFYVIAEGLELEDHDHRLISVIRSGAIPRMFKMPKALSHIVGFNLHNNGEVTQTPPKNINNLKKWYEQVMKSLPRNSFIIHSTTSPVWPYLTYIFKKATWAVVDLLFFLPGLLMTSGLQQIGRAYKTKSININYMIADTDKKDAMQIVSSARKQKSFSRANSNFFQHEEYTKIKKGNIVNCVSLLIKDPSQIRYLQENFRKEVGPQFGFDLNQIHKHYLHRRELRKQYPALLQGKLLPVAAQHIYGTHNNILSFIRYDSSEMILVSINFNSDAVDMHYNLTHLKTLFKNHQHSNKVIKVEDVLNPLKFVEEYYIIGELVNSKIDARIEPYKTIIWRLSIAGEDKLQAALKCSSLRMKERLNRTPPAWIYSSVFFNELSYLLDNVKTKYGIAIGLNTLYNKLIAPYDLSFSLVISKNYEFYMNKHKLQKLFGIFKLVSNHSALSETLNTYITGMLSGNTLGPIAFVTPQIGSWSSVGGLGVMVDELSKELARLGEEVYIITPYYQYNKKKETNYLLRDGFKYERNVKVTAAHFQYQFGIHRGKYCGVNYIWFHNPELFSKPYDGQGAAYVTKQLVFFALITLQAFCQLKIFPSIMVTNDWVCGFVSAYVKCQKYNKVFDGTKFMHICHNLDPLYQGRLYPKVEEGNLNWLVQLPPEWYVEFRNNKIVINPSKCALETCDNWGTVSHSYKVDLLKESPLAPVLWKYPHPFSFPNGIRKDQRLSILRTKTPGNHLQSKKLLQQRYFKCQDLKNDIPLFSFIGRITKQKGVHLILDAIESLLYEYNFNIQFLVGGSADSKEDYGKYCADKMRFLNHKYPNCFWSNPDLFFSDGPLVNIGSDFSLMPSMFEPGGIVQHEFFCAGTPVIAFRTGGLKDTVFEFDPATLKGNGFNFMSYQLQDYKRCVRRALQCYKNRPAYEKLRENAAESVIEEEDVARGWNNQFYRMQNKIYIDWLKVQYEIRKFKIAGGENEAQNQEIALFNYSQSDYWKQQWQNIDQFKEVLKNASRLKGKLHSFCFQTKKIPRPKQVAICGSWDDWKSQTKLNFDKIQKNYKISFKLKPGLYQYKYVADNEWLLTENEEKEIDQNNNVNHIVTIE